MIALCPKCYYVEKAEGEKKKLSTKGMSKKQNEITWQRFKAALEGSKGSQEAGRADGDLRAAEAGAERLLRQTVSSGRWDTHRTNRMSPLGHVSWWKRGIWRDNQQLFTNETAPRAVTQIVENGLMRLDKRPFNRENLQRPDGVCGSF